jgi:tight adherence protein C
MIRWLAAVAAAFTTGLLARRLIRLRRAARHNHLLMNELPDVVDLLIVLVRAGLTPTQAVDELAMRCPPSWQQPFRAVHDARRIDHLRAIDALDRLLESAGAPARGIVDALAASERFGQPLIPALERLSIETRAMRRRLHEVHARQLPVRLSFPLVLCTLPAFGLVTIVPLVASALTSLRNAGGAP